MVYKIDGNTVVVSFINDKDEVVELTMADFLAEHLALTDRVDFLDDELKRLDTLNDAMQEMDERITSTLTNLQERVQTLESKLRRLGHRVDEVNPL